jgi:hypothetical protein
MNVERDMRVARRAAARARVRRNRRVAGSIAAVTLIVLLAVAFSGGGSSKERGHPSAAQVARKAPLPDGGPLAPASVGGLAALWAPANVVGYQPGTSAAYEPAARKTGLPGDLMIADRGNNRILVVDPAKRIVFRYPPPGAGSPLFFDDDTFVEPGGRYIISNEEGSHAIVQVDIARRSQTVLFGEVGVAGSDSTHVKEPDDAYMLPDGTLTVADAANCRVLFIRAHAIVRSYGQAGVCHHDPPRYFAQVNGDTPVPGGAVLVSEIEGNWVDEIGPEGTLRWAVQAPVSYPSDPQPLPGGRVLLADYANPGHVLIMDHLGHVLWRYGPRQGPGRMDHPSLAMPLPNGDVAVNDDYRHRVIVIDPRTSSIVWQYGHTDEAGTVPGYLNTPDGLDFIPQSPSGAPDYAAVIHP